MPKQTYFDPAPFDKIEVEASSSATVRRTLPDGLAALREQLESCEIMRLIERTARWVDPETFRLLPVWYPEFARRSPLYVSDWSEPQMNRNRQTGASEHKREGNMFANKALTQALGLRSADRQNWSCCHIWGIDDATFQESNAVVQDNLYYSCVANMVLLPTPLKAFTDAMPEVKAMLRVCARNTYDWRCEHESMAAAAAAIAAWGDWSAYPDSWPRAPGASVPLGTMAIDGRIRAEAAARLERIRRDLAGAGPHYPRDAVRAVLARWDIEG